MARIRNQYTDRLPEYNFDNAVLESTDFICKEQHASAAQVYLVVAWQLKHRISPVDLTSDGHTTANNVGPVDRMNRIRLIPHDANRKRLVSTAVAQSIKSDFNEFLIDLN